MEKEPSRGDGFSISDSKSTVPNSDDGVTSRKLRSVEDAFPGCRFDGGGGGGGGPTGSNSGGANDVVGQISYYDNVSSSRLGVENFSTNSQQPFDIFAASHSTSSPKSPEGIMATSVAFPFTSAQWKELERQAMIYKYMIYSVPVPSDLLLPLARNDSSISSTYSVRYGKNGDLEPGRCKRTDGKKWRCSKDVAPNQKYCERHLHRGRPRSRKPVEDKNNINGDSNKKKNSDHFSATNNERPLLLFNPENGLGISKSNAPSSNRDLSLMMMESELKRQRLIETNLGFSSEGCSIYGSSSPFDQDYQLNALSSYSNFTPSEMEAPISFIDAWSVDNGNVEPSGPTEPESLSPSLKLSISMASGRHSDQELARVTCCDDQSVNDSGPVFWGPFTGGPLAEAFNNPASPRDSVTTVATTVESPTGVLHRTLFSHSDGSVCNSPTFPAPMSEVAFRWLN